MRAIFFILVGIGLTFAAIHYMGPERFLKLYQGIVSTGNEIAAGGGIDTITEKLNAGNEPPASGAGNSYTAPSAPAQSDPHVGAPVQP